MADNEPITIPSIPSSQCAAESLDPLDWMFNNSEYLHDPSSPKPHVYTTKMIPHDPEYPTEEYEQMGHKSDNVERLESIRHIQKWMTLLESECVSDMIDNSIDMLNTIILETELKLKNSGITLKYENNGCEIRFVPCGKTDKDSTRCSYKMTLSLANQAPYVDEPFMTDDQAKKIVSRSFGESGKFTIDFRSRSTHKDARFKNGDHSKANTSSIYCTTTDSPHSEAAIAEAQRMARLGIPSDHRSSVPAKIVYDDDKIHVTIEQLPGSGNNEQCSVYRASFTPLASADMCWIM